MSSQIQRIEGSFEQSQGRFAIICSRFNDFIVKRLEEGAIDTLIRHGVAASNISVFYVPGALELPVLAKHIADSKKYDAIIALGAVIRGSTAHFDVVMAEQAKGLAHVALNSGYPVINGVLTTDTIEQAIERAGTKAGNKGSEAALAALEMTSLLKKIAL